MGVWTKAQKIALAAACTATFGAVYVHETRTGPSFAATSTGRPAALPVNLPDAALRSASAASPRMAPDGTLIVQAAPPPDTERESLRPESEAVDETPDDDSLQQLAANAGASDMARLLEVARSDGNARNRMVAIRGLEHIAMLGIDDGTSVRTLRELAASDDAEVARAARLTIRRIGRRRAPD